MAHFWAEMRFFDNGDLADFRNSTADDGISGISRKLFRHAHDKLAALTEIGVSFLSQYFHTLPSVPLGVISFERGKIYSRRADIHIPFGGQEQGGIDATLQPRNGLCQVMHW